MLSNRAFFLAKAKRWWLTSPLDNEKSLSLELAKNSSRGSVWSCSGFYQLEDEALAFLADLHGDEDVFQHVGAVLFEEEDKFAGDGDVGNTVHADFLLQLVPEVQRARPTGRSEQERKLVELSKQRKRLLRSFISFLPCTSLLKV